MFDEDFTDNADSTADSTADSKVEDLSWGADLSFKAVDWFGWYLKLDETPWNTCTGQEGSMNLT